MESAAELMQVTEQENVSSATEREFLGNLRLIFGLEQECKNVGIGSSDLSVWSFILA